MNKFLLILLTIVLFSLIVIGCAEKCESSNTLTGTIYISGNEPFTHLSLKSEDDNYYKIECPDSLKKELWELQGRKVELTYKELKDFTTQKVAVISEYTVKQQNVEEEKND